MATSGQIVQIDAVLNGRDIEANLSNPFAQPTAIAGSGSAARVLSCVGDLDEMFFFIALCGFWTNALLHGFLVFLYLTQSAFYDAICWSFATMVWGIVALSVHSVRNASQAPKFWDPSNAPALSAQTQIAEALTLIVLITWYKDAVVQKTSPYKDLFSMCGSSARWNTAPASAFYWGNLLAGITPSQCDLATAIANVTWVGPIALLLAVWMMLFRWIGTPTETSEIVPDVVESAPALKSVELFPALVEHRHECLTSEKTPFSAHP